MSTLATVEPSTSDWPLLPTETEIYILPDGRVIIADLPAELADYLLRLGTMEPCAPAVAAPQAAADLAPPYPGQAKP